LCTLIGYHTSLLRMMTVVVLCGVLGWCMRASRTLICYHASLLKMFCNCRKFYDSRKSTTVACSACLCGEFGWCMRALHTLIGYHTSLVKTITVIQTHQTEVDADMDVDTDSDEQEQEHGAGICKIVVLVTIVVMWCGLFGWCMRASSTFIVYHASFLRTMMVIKSNQTKVDVDSNKQEQEHRSTWLAIATLLSWWPFLSCAVDCLGGA